MNVLKYFLFVILLTAAWSVCSYGTIIMVPSQTPSIQSAINFTVDGDTVLVDTGTYHENINFNGKKIIVASNYLLTGDPIYIQKTIINGSTPSNPNRASVVLFITGEDSSSILEGFTLTGGKGTVWQDHHNLNFYREGGGILTDLSSPTIRNNLIINNTANTNVGVSSSGGGGIRCSDGNPRILNNVIMQNDGRYGGGIVLNYTGAIIKNNIIYKNTGGQDFGGSGIWSFAAGPAPILIENNTIVENNSALDGGGILVQSVTMTIRNNIVWANIAPIGPQISVTGGTAIVSYCDVQGGFTGTGNFSQYPNFTDTSFTIFSTSACMDAGNPGAAYNDPEDPLNPGFALAPSIGTVRNDVGAYGGPGTLPQIAFIAHSTTPQLPTLITAYSDYQTPASIRLNWHDPQSTVGGSPLSNFKIRIYRGNTFVADVDSGLQLYVDTNLILHQQYKYYLRAVTPVDSSRVDSAAAYAGGSAFPGAPKNFAETDLLNGVNLRWRNPTLQADGTPLNDFASIFIFRDGVLIDSIVQTLADTGQVRSYNDTAMGYHLYKIYARDNEVPAHYSASTDSLIGFSGVVNTFLQGFESGVSPMFRTGLWDTTSVIADSGFYSITDSPGGNFPISTTTFILTPGVALGSGMELRYRDIAVVRPGSFCAIDISINHRNTFTTIKAYNWTGHPLWSDGVANPGDWTKERIDFSLYAGDTITVRFRLVTGSLSVSDGWYIDNISIAPIPPPQPVSVQSGLRKAWNMVSLPVKKNDHSIDSVFPGAISRAFNFHSGYAVVDSIQNGPGFWVKYPDTTTLSLSGLPLYADTIGVAKGWNMVGSISDTVDTAAVVKTPAGIVTTGYYTYTDTGYAASRWIIPGRAYWVKVSNAGSLIVSHPPPPPAKASQSHEAVLQRN